jgi:hypothetical protein
MVMCGGEPAATKRATCINFCKKMGVDEGNDLELSSMPG